jgi:plastocyanin
VKPRQVFLVSMLAAVAVLTGCAAARPYGRAVAVDDAPHRTIESAGAQHGFEPARVQVRAGEVVRLVFTRTGERECMEKIELWFDQTRTVVHELAVGESAEVALRFDTPGDLGIATGDRHYGAVIEVRAPHDDR